VWGKPGERAGGVYASRSAALAHSHIFALGFGSELAVPEARGEPAERTPERGFGVEPLFATISRKGK
jgi:hypothetical protein